MLEVCLTRFPRSFVFVRMPAMCALLPHLARAARTSAHAPTTLLLPLLSAHVTSPVPVLLAVHVWCSMSHMALQLPAANNTSAHCGAALRRVLQFYIAGRHGAYCLQRAASDCATAALIASEEL